MILAHWHKLKEFQVPRGIEFVTSNFTYLPEIDDGQTLPVATLTGIQSGDLVLANVVADTGVPNLQSGWTNIGSFSGLHDARWSYQFATGSSVSYDNGGGDDEAVVLAAFRNVNQTTPLDVTIPTPVGGNNSSTSVTPPSITTVTDGCMIVVGLGIDDNDKTNATLPSGYTTASFGFQTNANSGVFYKKQTSAGTESPSTISYSGGEANACITIAFRPA